MNTTFGNVSELISMIAHKIFRNIRVSIFCVHALLCFAQKNNEFYFLPIPSIIRDNDAHFPKNVTYCETFITSQFEGFSFR